MTAPASLARELRDLRGLMGRLLEVLSRPKLQIFPAEIVPLSTYCALTGRAEKTVRNDLCCSNPERARRHPEFRRCGGIWVTDADALRRWYETGRSSYHGPRPVEDALQRAVSGRRR